MDWQANWIWAGSHLDTPNCYVYARKEFEVVAAPSAEASVACSGEYKLYVNGRYIGRGATYGKTYDTHDLSHVIRPGKNVIAAICYNPGSEDTNPAAAGFLLQLEITRNGDPVQLVATDETWKLKPAVEWDLKSAPIDTPRRYQEVYDSRAKPVGWNVVGFDDTAWPVPAIADEGGTRLVPRQIPPLRECDVHPKQVIECGIISAIDDPGLDVATRMYSEPTRPDPSAIKYPREMLSVTGDAAVVSPGPDSYVVLDFSVETVGYLCVKIRGGGQAVVDIGYSEVLDPSGRVWPTRGASREGDRLILHGGRQEWQTFGRRVFRYVQLTFRNVQAPISVESVSAVSVGYPVEMVSTFECSEELLNRIWRSGVYTLGLCMQDKYESGARVACENAADAQLQALFNYYCFFDSALAAHALEQTFESSQAQGTGLAWVEMLYDLYRYTGDIGLVTQLYPRLRMLIDDHAGGELDHTATHCAYHCQALRDASKLAAAVSTSEDALRWHEQATGLQRTFDERFWDEEQGLYIDDGGLRDGVNASFLAILFGLADAGRTRTIWPRLSNATMRDLPSADHLLHALQAMAKLDQMDTALGVVRAVWGGMLSKGATSWWEAFPLRNGMDAAELCRGSASAPTYFLPAEVLGVKPSTPGVVMIQPRPGGLQWAKGHIKTISGYVDVEWHDEDGVFRIDIEAPPGFIVALPIAGLVDPVIDEIDLTPETPERRARRTYGWANTIWRGGVEHVPYLDWLASQSTEPPSDYHYEDRCSVEGSHIWVGESVSTHVRYEVREG